MIAYLKGPLIERGQEHAVLEAGGVGYEVMIGPSTAARLPMEGGHAELFISESTAMYGGGTTLYGFLTREEKDLFLCIRDNVPGTGAKKSLEYLEKASRSLPDFRRAVLDEDARLLTGVFGFTKKTADKLLAALKDKLGKVQLSGEPRLQPAGAPAPEGAAARALEALSSLGYRPAEARAALESVLQELKGREAGVEEIIRLALRRL